MEKFYEHLRIRLSVARIGHDLCITISGGDKPHIGSVAIAEPRESLRGNGARSATVSTFNFIGHKDDEIANSVARAVSAQLCSRTVVLCGVHYDNICESTISEVQELTQQIIADSISLASMTGFDQEQMSGKK